MIGRNYLLDAYKGYIYHTRTESNDISTLKSYIHLWPCTTKGRILLKYTFYLGMKNSYIYS